MAQVKIKCELTKWEQKRNEYKITEAVYACELEHLASVIRIAMKLGVLNSEFTKEDIKRAFEHIDAAKERKDTAWKDWMNEPVV